MLFFRDVIIEFLVSQVYIDTEKGYTLEKHFASVCASHNIKMKKAVPGISDFNEKLKDEAVIDNKTYLLIQRLGTIRNLCDHNKKQEPTKEDIEDLINGTDKILHEVL